MRSRVRQEQSAQPLIYQSQIEALSAGCFKDPFRKYKRYANQNMVRIIYRLTVGLL